MYNLLNNTLVREKIKKGIKDFLEFNENKVGPIQIMEHNESSAKIKSHSSECLHKESREIIRYQLISSSECSKSK